MNITIVAVGKIREKFMKDAIAEYSKRLTRYCKLNIVEVEDEAIPDNASEAQLEAVKVAEGLRIKKHLKEGAFVIVMHVDGKQLCSEELAARMGGLALSGRSNVYFVIGGSVGISPEILRLADIQLSISKMTFPHQLVRLILLEQVYRAFKINSGETYHK